MYVPAFVLSGGPVLIDSEGRSAAALSWATVSDSEPMVQHQCGAGTLVLRPDLTAATDSMSSEVRDVIAECDRLNGPRAKSAPLASEES